MKKVRAVQTKDYIADAIRNEILAGTMEPGEELTQETLAEMLGVSRMPVREALQLLEQEGFIERLPNRHMAVTRIEEYKLGQIMGMAAAMEAEIAICLCGDGRSGLSGHGSPAQALEAMSLALNAGQEEQAALQELKYHESLAVMLDNPYIEQMFRKILSGYVAYMIQKMGHDLDESYRLLCAVQMAMIHGNRETLYGYLQQYYKALLACWNRKG